MYTSLCLYVLTICATGYNLSNEIKELKDEQWDYFLKFSNYID